MELVRWVWRVLQVCRRVEVVVMVVRRGVLRHVAELGVMWVHGALRFGVCPGRVVEVDRVWCV